ncbi:MAG: TetR/AcrR family transcriptional regulator [Oscillospiraceae bacterium]
MQQLTKDHILQSFNSLLRECPFEKITVKMILDRSGVSKSTFYRLYLDKYDVMFYNYKRRLDKWVGSEECKSWRELYLRIFTATNKDRKREKNAFSYVGTNSYFSALYTYSFEKIEKITVTARGTPLTKEERLQLSLFCYGGISVNMDWINNKFECSIDEMTEQIFMAMPATLRYEWCNL